MIKYVFCCDWGTSSLRVRLADAATGGIIDQEVSKQGTSSIFDAWRQRPEARESNDRVNFYLAQLKQLINKISTRTELQNENVPVIISGMASSSVGITELPYVELPFALSGLTAGVHHISASPAFRHPVMIISGLKDGQEVMRGEETQLVGVAPQLDHLGITGRITILMPGTHSKHVFIYDRDILGIKTYVTGELFAIISQNGLLREAVQSDGSLPDREDWDAFSLGVEESGDISLLQGLFKTRTNQLLGRLTKQRNHYYLSGMLIGYELRSLLDDDCGNILLCSEAPLNQYYSRALEFLQFRNVHSLHPDEVELATVNGQLKIAQPYLLY